MSKIQNLQAQDAHFARLSEVLDEAQKPMTLEEKIAQMKRQGKPISQDFEPWDDQD